MTPEQFVADLRDDIEFDGEEITFRNLKRFREKRLDALVYQAVFHANPDTRGFLRWLIRSIAHTAGVVPASIRPFYSLKGHGKFNELTVPAFNVRGMTYDVARAIARAALANSSATFMYELARSEMGYTDQRPDEYAIVVIAAALREGYTGPVFIQGDHFQVNAKKMISDPEGEIAALENLIRESLSAGFYNIDIDASTLVDLKQSSLDEQQRTNYEMTARLTRFIREHQPEGMTVSVGGEIGEVGGKNSTIDELRAFLDGYIRELNSDGKKRAGLSKVSVQSGTTHGGIPLPDGTIADVAIDFRALKELSRMAIDSYKLAGVVQHGASTLPETAFDQFPDRHVAEIHLATDFQNYIYDSEAFPKDFYQEIVQHLKSACGDERKPEQTDEQFIYKTRKKAFGPFKKKFWDLPVSTREALGKGLEAKLSLLFKRLKAVKTVEAVAENVEYVKVRPTLPIQYRSLFKL